MYELVARQPFFSEIAWLSELADKVIAGERPAQPSWCPPGYAEIMEGTWAQKMEDRMSWRRVISKLKKLKKIEDELEQQYAAGLRDFVKDKKAKKDSEKLQEISGMHFS